MSDLLLQFGGYVTGLGIALLLGVYAMAIYNEFRK